MRRLVHVRTGPRRKVQHNRPTGPQSDKFTFNSHCATVQAKTDLIPNNKSFVKKKIQCERRLAPVIVPGLTSMCVQTILRGLCLVSNATEGAPQLLRFRRRLPRLRSDFGGRAVEAFCQDAASEGGVDGDSLLGAAGSVVSFSRVRMVASRSERC